VRSHPGHRGEPENENCEDIGVFIGRSKRGSHSRDEQSISAFSTGAQFSSSTIDIINFLIHEGGVDLSSLVNPNGMEQESGPDYWRNGFVREEIC